MLRSCFCCCCFWPDNRPTRAGAAWSAAPSEHGRAIKFLSLGHPRVLSKASAHVPEKEKKTTGGVQPPSNDLSFFCNDQSPFYDRAHGGVALEGLPRAPRGWGARKPRRAQRARIAERSLGRSPLFASSARLHNHPLPRSSTSGHVVQKPPPRRRRRRRCEFELDEPAPPTSSPQPPRAWSRPGRRTNRQAAAAPRARAGVMIWLSV